MTRVVVLGGGSAGEAFVGALSRLEGDFQMTLVERALVGGECTYWACMPSKTLLRAPELLAAARQAPGAAEAASGALDLERVFWWRDQVVDGLRGRRTRGVARGSRHRSRPRRRDGEGPRRPRRRRARASVRQARHRHRLASGAAADRRARGRAPLDDGERHGVERRSRVARGRRRRCFWCRARAALPAARLAGDDRPAQPAADEDGRGGRFAPAGAARGGRRARAVRRQASPGSTSRTPG